VPLIFNMQVTATSHIYIYAAAIYILKFITAQTSCHNFGPDALARKQCRTPVLATPGRALSAGAHGPVLRAPATTPSPREKVRPCTCGRWGATAPALEVRRRHEQVRWNRLQTNLLVPPLVAIVAQNPPMLCPKGHQPFGHTHSTPPC
jgi:hypothetical protein